MTRAEILDCLTDRPCNSCKFHESGRCERWDCVFEEKPDDCEDAISRQAVLDELKELDDQDLYLPIHFKQILDGLPSVTPKQKIGCWIHTDECDEEWQYRCSICNMPSKSNAHRYCSKCGSYMYGIEPDGTGHWIYTKAVSTGEIIWSECSVCGEGEHGCAKRMKFCPNCGVKMAESEDTE